MGGQLLAKRASKHRPGGPWSGDDFDVYDGPAHVGRILWSYAAPAARPWFWSITARCPQAMADRGDAENLAAAIAACGRRHRYNAVV